MQAAGCGQAESTQGSRNVMPKCGGMAMAIGAMTPIMLWAPMTPIYQRAVNRDADYRIVRCGGRHKGFEPLHQSWSGQLMAALVAIFVGGDKNQ